MSAEAEKPARAAGEATLSSFYAASPSTTFRGLGLGVEVVEAARRAGFMRPSRMQELAIPDLLDDERNHAAGTDVPAHVVLTGETGCGKTLAYVLPLMQRLLDAPASGARALVLVPSPALADQIVALVARLVDASGQPLLRAELGSLAEAPFALPGNPLSNAPAMVVSTPTAIIDHLQVHYSAASSRRWFVRHLRHLVLDEADTLLSAGYDKPLRTLFSLLLYGRYDHPMLSKIFSAGGQQRHLFQTIAMLSRGTFEASPQLVLSAATLPAGNSPRAVGTMLAAALPRARWPRTERVHRAVEDVTFEWRELDRLKPTARAEQVFGAPTRRAAAGASGQPSPQPQPAAAASEGSQGGPRAARELTIEAAAAAAGLELAPPPPPDDQLARLVSPALAPAVAAALRAVSARPNALVFCNKAVHADALAAGLRLEGLRAATYHRAVPRYEREEALRLLSRERRASGGGGAHEGGEGGEGGEEGAQDSMVLVCTDAAARGLDLPAVEHVVHAEFAQNAVSFIHRSGRVGRAGRPGRVTCLYTKEDGELVGQLRTAMEAGQALEPVFSRRRSFRKRINRREGGEGRDDGVPEAELEPDQAGSVSMPSARARGWD